MTETRKDYYTLQPANPSEIGGYQAQSEHEYVVEFDYRAGFRYLCVWPSICLPCCYPCIALCARKSITSQRCTITDRRVVFESGWLDHSSRNIPLDRIQDVNVRQDCCAKCFNAKTVEIQTAGAGSEQAEATLIAPANAEMLRDVIMERRDALVFGHTGLMTETGVASRRPTLKNAGAKAEHAMLKELGAINETLVRLEAQVAKGVEHLATKPPEQQQREALESLTGTVEE